MTNPLGFIQRITPLAFAAALMARPLICLHAQTAVSVPAVDGGVVAADLYGRGDRGLVLAHGGRFDRSSWRDQAQQLAAAGFRVLALDFRAAVEARAGRESPCLYDETCLARDVLAAVRYLRQAGAGSVSIVGASLGGGAAAQAAVEAEAGEIERLVLLAHMPIASPERIQGRKLFVVARHDSGSAGPRLPEIQSQYARAPGPKRMVVVEGSAHAQFLFQTPSAPHVMGEILRFLTEP